MTTFHCRLFQPYWTHRFELFQFEFFLLVHLYSVRSPPIHPAVLKLMRLRTIRIPWRSHIQTFLSLSTTRQVISKFPSRMTIAFKPPQLVSHLSMPFSPLLGEPNKSIPLYPAFLTTPTAIPVHYLAGIARTHVTFHVALLPWLRIVLQIQCCPRVFALISYVVRRFVDDGQARHRCTFNTPSL
jgi:hypothetical protein